MATVKTVWGVDIGQCALKALKLRMVEGVPRVEAFDIIEHPVILSQPGADRDQLIRNALEQFLAGNNVVGSTVVISAPSQSGFTRFVKLPPVESSKVPEIVRFEAEQQIPFDIAEVIWRWQAFTDPDSPDVEVGIFAMKRADVGDVLDRFQDAGMRVDVVQMAPLALYNFASFDEQTIQDGATLVVDVGTDKTDLVVADGPRIWTRTLQVGGSNFTAALVKAFKLSFAKAEKHKRAAATSKYARQIFQAMRPVFAELVQEVQRSIGYYTQLHRESRFKRVLGLGNGFRLPGLQKFLEQNLNIPVLRVDSYNKLATSALVNAPRFTENVLSFAVAYGLALQGLGATRIQTNLLPSEIARKRLWAKKRPWFAAAAAMVLVALAGWAGRLRVDANTLDPGPQGTATLQAAEQFVRHQRDLQAQRLQIQGGGKREEDQILEYDKMLAFRGLHSKLYFALNEAFRTYVRDHQVLLTEKGVPELRNTPRGQRRVVYIREIRSTPLDDVGSINMQQLYAHAQAGAAGGPGAGLYTPSPYAAPPMLSEPGMGPTLYSPPSPPGQGGEGTAATAPPVVPAQRRGLILVVEGTTPMQEQFGPFLDAIAKQFKQQAAAFEEFEVLKGVVVPLGPVAPPQAARALEDVGAIAGKEKLEEWRLDPLTREDIGNDKRFRIAWTVAIKPDPVGAPGAGPTGQETQP